MNELSIIDDDDTATAAAWIKDYIKQMVDLNDGMDDMRRVLREDILSWDGPDLTDIIRGGEI